MAQNERPADGGSENERLICIILLVSIKETCHGAAQDKAG